MSSRSYHDSRKRHHRSDDRNRYCDNERDFKVKKRDHHSGRDKSEYRDYPSIKNSISYKPTDADLEQLALQALTDEIRPKNERPTKTLVHENKESKPIVKEKVNFSTSGKLAEDTNKFNGVIINYSEPVEAKKPSRKWRLYPFKGDQPLPHIEIHKQSAFLIGRDRRVVDIPTDHPSCSNQHAVIQFRVVDYEKEDGSQSKRIRPYLMDLNSANGTFLNNKPIESHRYYELLEKDVIKFGFSSREYVVLTENSDI